MITKTFPLSKLRHEHGKHVIDKTSGLQVFHVSTPHTLIQAAGYLKYTRGREYKKGVFFRGQTRLYSILSPTLLRGAQDGPQKVKRIALIDDFLKDLNEHKRALRAVDKQCQEALLQHYGIRTTWIDVVDNIWVALWFACNQAKAFTQGDNEYLHFEKRVDRLQSTGDPEYAYVLLLESAYFDSIEDHPGHYKDSRSETIDLRIAAPSQFIRPHAQHGLLVRSLSKKGLPVSDCSRLHVGTIRVNLNAALDWLGNASTLTCHSLFPPAYYDYGYRELLDSIQPQNNQLGFIHRVQA